MRHLLFLIFIIGVKGEAITSGLTTTAGTKLHKKIIGPIEKNGSKASNKRISKYANKYGIGLEVNEEDVTNEENFIRPCKFDDLECIRQFFARNAHCKLVRGPIDPLYLPQLTGFLPYINTTLTFTNVTVTGMDKAEVIEFYRNKKTCKVVLAIRVPELIESTPEAIYQYHRTAKETIVLSDWEIDLYKNIIFTIIFDLTKFRLDLAEAHGYFNEAIPTYNIGPKAYTSEDPDVMDAYSTLLETVPISVTEWMLLQAQLLTAIYVQRNICDFGLDLFSV